MEYNHDVLKEQASARIRQFAKTALVISVLFFIGQTFLYLRRIIWNLAYPNPLPGMTPIGYPTGDLIVKCILTDSTLILLTVLFSRLRKNGLPFTQTNSILLTAAGILQGLYAVLPAFFWLGTVLRYNAFSEPHIYLQFFRPNVMNYLSLSFCILLLFLARTFRYGAALQQESDETL